LLFVKEEIMERVKREEEAWIRQNYLTD
jgi:hypothetical protein